MHDLVKQLSQLNQEIDGAWFVLKFDQLGQKQQDLMAEMARPDFWNNNERARTISQEEAGLRSRLAPWQELKQAAADLAELADSGDEALLTELTDQLARLQQSFSALKEELKYDGPYDDHNVILTILAGAGGTDAQDWAQMLLRMYVRWAEKQNFDVTIIDQSSGDEAGLKSATVAINGNLAYGKLKLEHGVHRLVRLSPFNSDNLRQTSFARVEVMPEIRQDTEIQIDDKDLRVDVYRAGGHGGQSVNTTDSAVRLTHLPTGIMVAIQNERSQLQNKEIAMTLLRSKLAQLQLEQHAEKLSELKGPNEQASWGNQIRSYVLHPYKQVKDLRSRFETSNVETVLDGDLDPMLQANIEWSIGQ